MKTQLKTVAGLALICTPFAVFANTGTINQTGANQDANAVFTTTTGNTVQIDQAGSDQEALVTIINGGTNTVGIIQDPLAFHDVNLRIRNGNDNIVNILQDGLDNNAGEPGGSRIRIINGDRNEFDIDQNALSAFNDLDVDVLDGDDNTVTVSQQAASFINDADIRIENANDNDVLVFQSVLAGANTADVDIVDGDNSDVEIFQVVSGLSSATVDITGSNANYSIAQTGCLGCAATETQN